MQLSVSGTNTRVRGCQSSWLSSAGSHKARLKIALLVASRYDVCALAAPRCSLSIRSQYITRPTGKWGLTSVSLRNA